MGHHTGEAVRHRVRRPSARLAASTSPGAKQLPRDDDGHSAPPSAHAAILLHALASRRQNGSPNMGCTTLPKPVSISQLRHMIHKWLPRVPSASQHLPQLEEPLSLQRNCSGVFAGRVLLVEDDMITRSASDLVFQHVGLCADIAADGESAMEMLRRRDYDLLLLVRPPCPRARASSNCLPLTLTLTLTPTLTLTLRRPGCAPSGRERLRALLVVQEHHAQRGAPDWVRTSDLTLTLAFILTFSVALALTLIAGTWSPSRPTRTCRRAVVRFDRAYPSRSPPTSSRPSKPRAISAQGRASG